MGSVLSALTGKDGSKVIRYILAEDPFQPFYESLVYVVLQYTYESNQIGGWEEVESYFVYTPPVACVLMVILGFIFFTITIIIDTWKLNKFKTEDMRQPTWHPRYLAPDEDVLREVHTINQD